jgi:hypothetical protein
MTLRASAIFAAALCLCAGSAQAILLINPGADTGNLTGWTVGGTSNPFVDNGAFDPSITPLSGGFDFAGGKGGGNAHVDGGRSSGAGLCLSQTEAMTQTTP